MPRDEQDQRPETFGDGSTREQQDALVREHEEAQESITKLAQAGRDLRVGSAVTSEEPVQLEEPKQPEPKQPEPKQPEPRQAPKQSAG